MKFPTENWVRELRGDQVLARECYQVALAIEENHTWTVEEAMPEKNHAKELEEIQLAKADRTKTTKRVDELELEMKMKVMWFLKNNQDVFA